MEEKDIYKAVLERLYSGLGTEKHDKFKNDRLSERRFSVDNLYPDVILTKKGTETIDFIIEIVVKEHLNSESLEKKWLPLSKQGPTLYLLVPKSNLKQVEKWCADKKVKSRFGTYEIKKNEVDIKFF